MTIINDDDRIVNKLDASFTDDARVVIYDRHMFIVQATSVEIDEIYYIVLSDHFLSLGALRRQ
jgi:hypothetical protein